MKTRLTIMRQKPAPRSVRLKLLMPDGSLETWSLRDYFAAHADGMPSPTIELQKQLASKEYQNLSQIEFERFVAGLKARWRYTFADAMLAAREDRTP